MTGRNIRLTAGAVALVGGLWGLFNPTAAQFASTTIAGWALLIVGLLQGRAAWQATEARERAGAQALSCAASRSWLISADMAHGVHRVEILDGPHFAR